MTETQTSTAKSGRAQVAETMRLIRLYVRARIVAETEARAASAAIAEKTDFTTSHIAQVRHNKCEPGEEFCRTMAGFWGLTYAQLEEKACASANSALQPSDA